MSYENTMKTLLLAGLMLASPFLAAAQHDHAEHGQAEHDHAEHGQAEHGHDVHKKGMHHDFSDAEKWSERFDDPARDAWQKPQEVVRLMELGPGMMIADLGAGTGYFLGHLVEATQGAGKILGLDVEAEMVAFMNERAKREGWFDVVARQIPLDDPHLADGSIDRILIVDTWHHIDDRAAYSAKLLQALKPDGRIYIVDFTMDSPEGPPKQHRLKPEEVIAELEAGGLRAQQIEETLPRQFIVVARR